MEALDNLGNENKKCDSHQEARYEEHRDRKDVQSHAQQEKRLHDQMEGVVHSADSNTKVSEPSKITVEEQLEGGRPYNHPTDRPANVEGGDNSTPFILPPCQVAVESIDERKQAQAQAQLQQAQHRLQAASESPPLQDGGHSSILLTNDQLRRSGERTIDINSLLNPQPCSPTLRPGNPSSASHQPNSYNLISDPEPTQTENPHHTNLPEEVRKAGSVSSLSAESTNSNTTDTAYQFFQAHHGYQEHEIAAAFPGHQADATMSEESQPRHAEGSQPQPQTIDDSLPSDGYYPTSLHVDSEMSDTDSAIGSEVQSSTMTFASSLYESIMENGRSYHKYKEGQYYLPNDDVEQDRLNLQHHLWTLTLDGNLNLAPVKNPQRVLDIGTGTGLWALEYAERHPSAMVIGTDLSAIQPEYVPPNCQFEIDDAEDEWTYSAKFDFIHGRALFTCFQDPAKVFKRAYDALAPGGYFEMQDIHFSLESIDGTADDSAIRAWNKKLCEGAAKIGRDWHCAVKYAQFMRDAGFEAVIERAFKWPSNTWPKGKKQKLLGMWSMANWLDGLPSISMAIMTRAHGMTRDEVEVGMVQIRSDIKNKAIHGYVPIYVVYGRKPLVAEKGEGGSA